MSAASPGEKKGLSSWLRPKKSRQKLRKRGAASLTSASSTSLASVYTNTGHAGYDADAPPLPMAPLQAHREKYRQAHTQLDSQLGENRDYTAMLHALGLNEPFDDGPVAPADEAARPPGERAIASLPKHVWRRIVDYLNPQDAASLALASRTLYRRLGPRPFAVLNRPENYEYKLDFLVYLDRSLPHHLLCIPCAKYHRRTQEGHEQLQPAHVLNPLFNCPNARNMLRPPPRHRIAHGRVLPFTFVQLVMRAHRFASPSYGLSPESLARRWRRDGWSFSTRYHIHDGRLLMRVVSSTFAPPGLTPSGQRMLLFSREDYWPFFSVCAHWRDGELMSVCKCALSHVPQPRETAGFQSVENRFKDALKGRSYDPNAVASLCGHCQPMRRCPECPTEYLVEIKLTEDRSDPKSIHFRHAIVVTRWSDLGDGTTPFSSREWAACTGTNRERYDSFAALGKRAISGVFESAFTHDTIPGRRILSMNPTGKKGGEDDDDWY